MNLNILREIFRRFSVIPGLVKRLESRLPESYKERFQAQHTLFQPIGLKVNVQDGAFLFAKLHVATVNFELNGSGKVGLDGTMAAQTQIWIEPQMSAALIRSVEELKYLTDDEGRLELPLVVHGVLPRVAVLPDIGYVTTRMVRPKAEELIGDLLEKAFEKDWLFIDGK